jgi:tetratricopeptide (TPR) repeat protein
MLVPPLETTKKLSNIAIDLEKLTNDKRTSDLKLGVEDQNGRHEFYVHKLLLAARSSVFNEKFYGETPSNDTELLLEEIKDREVASHFVHFLYTDVVAVVSEEIIEPLLILADKYDISRLKIACTEKLEFATPDEAECGDCVDYIGNTSKNDIIHTIYVDGSTADSIVEINVEEVNRLLELGINFARIEEYEQASLNFEAIWEHDSFNYRALFNKANCLYLMKRFEDAESVLQSRWRGMDDKFDGISWLLEGIYSFYYKQSTDWSFGDSALLPVVQILNNLNYISPGVIQILDIQIQFTEDLIESINKIICDTFPNSNTLLDVALAMAPTHEGLLQSKQLRNEYLSNMSITQVIRYGFELNSDRESSDALAVFDHACKREPDNVQAMAGKIVSLITLKEEEYAIKCFEAESVLIGDEITKFVVSSQYDEFLEFVIEHCPTCISALLEYGKSQLEYQPENAMSYFQKVLDIDPNNTEAQHYINEDTKNFNDITSQMRPLHESELDDEEKVRQRFHEIDDTLLYNQIFNPNIMLNLDSRNESYWKEVLDIRSYHTLDRGLTIDLVLTYHYGCPVFYNHYTFITHDMFRKTTVNELYKHAWHELTNQNSHTPEYYARKAVDLDPNHPCVPLLQRIMNPLTEIPYSRLVNEGGFGKITKIWPNMVVKVIFSDKGEVLIMEEMNNLQLVQGHENIITYHAHYISVEHNWTNIEDYLIASYVEGWSDFREPIPLSKNMWQFILMDRVEWTLADLLDADHLPLIPILTVQQISAIMIGLLNGLEHVHSLGMIHCDVKPANIGLMRQILTPSDVRILDFGAMTAIGVRPKALTRRYACPEFCLVTASPTMDIFSAGVVLQKCLEQVAQDTSLGQTKDNLIHNVVEKACALIPNLRYQSAREMKSDFERLWNDQLNGYQSVNVVTAGNSNAQLFESTTIE